MLESLQLVVRPIFAEDLYDRFCRSLSGFLQAPFSLVSHMLPCLWLERERLHRGSTTTTQRQRSANSLSSPLNFEHPLDPQKRRLVQIEYRASADSEALEDGSGHFNKFCSCSATLVPRHMIASVHPQIPILTLAVLYFLSSLTIKRLA